MDFTPTRNLKLIIAYNGSAYHGWQRQAKGIDTVQERVETAALRVLKHPLNVHGCSRTDAGVHAKGQVANIFTTNMAVPCDGMRKAMNSRLPADIVIQNISEASLDFNASRSAVSKTYHYHIALNPTQPVAAASQTWHYWRPLEIAPMQQAGRRLLGEHDFKGFASSLEDRQTTVRRIFRCDISETDGELLIAVTGNGFLYNMVRNIVGTLVEIGRGHWSPDRIDMILSTGDRKNAGPTAPPDGLCLQTVFYDQKIISKH